MLGKLKKILCLTLVAVLALGTVSFANSSEEGGNQKKTLKTVAYVPLDDRPCNLDRVILAGQSMGIEILTPDKNYFKTCLDGQPKNSTGLQVGSPANMVSWLRSVAPTVDGFIISLDQLNSGGLVGSRNSDIKDKVNPNVNINLELDRLKEVLAIIDKKPVYFFDTLMRLSPTIGFAGCSAQDYNRLIDYSKKSRLEYNDYESIVKNYDVTGDYGISEQTKNRYLQARARKFKLNIECLREIKKHPNAYSLISVDDSSNNNCIQTNEIKLLEEKEDAFVFAGTDEIAMCLLSRFATEQYMYKGLGRLPKVKVTYYGGGENEKADAFDYHSLNYSVEKHIGLSGGQLATSGHDIELLALTRTVTGSPQANARAMYNHMKDNLKNNIPTIVIDASDSKGDLQRLILSKECEAPKMLAYSSWNTVGNTTGLALGHGIGRFMFIRMGDEGSITRNALEGQVKLLFTEMVKDITYQLQAKQKFVDSLYSLSNGDENIVNNFWNYGIEQGVNWKPETNEFLYAIFNSMTTCEFNIHKVAQLFWGQGTNLVYEYYISPTNNKITQINWINYPFEDGTAYWFTPYFPWHRAYEFTFPVKVSFK